MNFQPQFCDHEVVQKSPHDYVEMDLSPEIILKAWSLSMFAHEILNKDGQIKAENQMTDTTLRKYIDAVEAIKREEELSKPMIGIGIMDGVEIGIGREIIAACHNLGISSIPVHIRKGQIEDLKPLLK